VKVLARVLLLAAALLAGAQLHSLPAQKPIAADVAIAPDGKRGFGRSIDQRALFDLLRSKSELDRAFFAELDELANSTRLLLMSLRHLYAERGYFHLLPGSAAEDFGALDAAYAKLHDSPAFALAAGDALAKALAAMLVDTRFNVRRELVSRAEFAVTDLEHARAVFGATVYGYVSLTPEEMQNIAARADLAAAELRALRSDLEALKPAPGEPLSKQELELANKLLELARIPDERMRAAQLRAVIDPRLELEKRMQPLLSSARIEPRLAELRAWRARVLKAAAEIHARVLELLPDTSQGETPSPEIARLKKSDRITQAYVRAIEALAQDPLDAEMAWAAAHAREFSWPGKDGVLYFDRFLVLSGIRFGDAIPGNGRPLTEREQEALSAVSNFKP